MCSSIGASEKNHGMPNVELRYPRITQDQYNWCWAAVTVGIDEFYGGIGWTQCRLANDLLVRDDCCRQGGTLACSKTYRLDEALAYIGRLDRFENAAQVWDTCDREITAQRPLGVRIELEGGMPAHAVVIIGVGTAYDQMVVVFDPRWSRRVMGIDELTSDYLGFRGRWARSFFTKR